MPLRRGSEDSAVSSSRSLQFWAKGLGLRLEALEVEGIEELSGAHVWELQCVGMLGYGVLYGRANPLPVVPTTGQIPGLTCSGNGAPSGKWPRTDFSKGFRRPCRPILRSPKLLMESLLGTRIHQGPFAFSTWNSAGAGFSHQPYIECVRTTRYCNPPGPIPKRVFNMIPLAI